jgi:hypothetical protein
VHGVHCLIVRAGKQDSDFYCQLANLAINSRRCADLALWSAAGGAGTHRTTWLTGTPTARRPVRSGSFAGHAVLMLMTAAPRNMNPSEPKAKSAYKEVADGPWS